MLKKNMVKTMKKYNLTLKLNFSARDDIEAREKVKKIIKYHKEYQVKLKEVFDNKEPRKINL
jgi:hypothetical protein